MLFIALLIVWLIHAGAFCGADDIHERFQPVIFNANNPPGRQLRERHWSPIRIKFLLLESVQKELDDQEYEHLTEFFLPRVSRFFRNWLKVQRRGELLKWEGLETYQNHWFEFETPQELKNGIEDTDLVILVNVDPSGGKNVAAQAGGCAFDAQNRNIPVVGAMWIFLDGWKETLFPYRFSILVHEIVHVLALTSNPFYYENWTDEFGQKYDMDSIFEENDYNGITHTYLRTPKVKQFVKNHFRCENIRGAPLENQGSEQSAGSHWERKFFGDEFMTAGLMLSVSYSELTFAMFEDTGWYKVDYSWANPLNWGKDTGCELFKKQCIAKNQAKFPMFCEEDYESKQNYQCTYNHLSKGYWLLNSTYSEIPSEYRYFDDESVGGDEFSDYWPYVRAHMYGDCRNTYHNYTSYAEVFEQDSRWIEFTRNNGANGLQCMEFLGCTQEAPQKVRFSLKVGEYVEELECEEDEIINWGGIDYKCPDPNVIWDDVPCAFGWFGTGRWVNSRCQCFPGFAGSYWQDSKVKINEIKDSHIEVTVLSGSILLGPIMFLLIFLAYLLF